MTHHLKHTGYGILLKKWLLLVILSFLYANGKLSAQSQEDRASGLSITHQGKKKIKIDLENDKVIYNLLVIISDSTGRTIFLDNQYRFKGNYSNTIDLETEKKGNYFLKIIKDEKRIEKNLRIE
jgi:hypothetical protein